MGEDEIAPDHDKKDRDPAPHRRQPQIFGRNERAFRRLRKQRIDIVCERCSAPGDEVEEAAAKALQMSLSAPWMLWSPSMW